MGAGGQRDSSAARLSARGVTSVSESTVDSAEAFYAECYDAVVSDWPGEIEFYRGLAAQATAQGRAVLEIGCGTGRVALRLAQAGARVVGLDRAPHMLAQARRKSAGMENVRWVEGDMRGFDLGERFGLVIIPGHSFQHLNAPDDQLACLACIARHLEPDGPLVVHLDHQDPAWLGDLLSGKGGGFEARGSFRRAATGRMVRRWQAWSYERATQTATSQVAWEEVEADGRIVARWQTDPVRLHCLFRFEMEHLLGRAGFGVEALYGGFDRQPLGEQSSEMVWLARRAQREAGA